MSIAGLALAKTPETSLLWAVLAYRQSALVISWKTVKALCLCRYQGDHGHPQRSATIYRPEHRAGNPCDRHQGWSHTSSVWTMDPNSRTAGGLIRAANSICMQGQLSVMLTTGCMSKGGGPAGSLPAWRQDWAIWWCRCGQDRAHHGAHQQRCQGPWCALNQSSSCLTHMDRIDMLKIDGSNVCWPCERPAM